MSTDPDTDALLATTTLEDLEGLPIEQVRALRATCIDVETGLSYLRRMVQGPLDIVERELRRRRDGGPADDLTTLIDALPELLSANTRSGGPGRLPTQLEPPTIDPVLAGELSTLVGRGQLAALIDLGDDDLAALGDALRDFERRVSERRRAFHTRIDALQGELTRRYTTGEASVESLLH